jgi:glycosyltransferase involved in cell wall biosynthesis
MPGVTGWLVPPRDPAAIAAAIGEALGLAAHERRQLAERSIAHIAARYTSEAMCAGTIRVYEELLFPQLTDFDLPAQPRADDEPIRSAAIGGAC